MGSEQRCVFFLLGGAYICSCQPLHFHDFTHQDAHFDAFPTFLSKQLRFITSPFFVCYFFVLGIFSDFFQPAVFEMGKNLTNKHPHRGNQPNPRGLKYRKPQRRSPQNVAKSKGIPTQIPLLQVWNNSNFPRYMDGPKNLHVELGV